MPSNGRWQFWVDVLVFARQMSLDYQPMAQSTFGDHGAGALCCTSSRTETNDETVIYMVQR